MKWNPDRQLLLGLTLGAAAMAAAAPMLGLVQFSEHSAGLIGGISGGIIAVSGGFLVARMQIHRHETLQAETERTRIANLASIYPARLLALVTAIDIIRQLAVLENDTRGITARTNLVAVLTDHFRSMAKRFLDTTPPAPDLGFAIHANWETTITHVELLLKQLNVDSFRTLADRTVSTQRDILLANLTMTHQSVTDLNHLLMKLAFNNRDIMEPSKHHAASLSGDTAQ